MTIYNYDANSKELYSQDNPNATFLNDTWGTPSLKRTYRDEIYFVSYIVNDLNINSEPFALELKTKYPSAAISVQIRDNGRAIVPKYVILTIRKSDLEKPEFKDIMQYIDKTSQYFASSSVIVLGFSVSTFDYNFIEYHFTDKFDDYVDIITKRPSASGYYYIEHIDGVKLYSAIV